LNEVFDTDERRPWPVASCSTWRWWLVAGHAARGERVSDERFRASAPTSKRWRSARCSFSSSSSSAEPANPLRTGLVASLFARRVRDRQTALCLIRGALRDAQPPGLGRECRRVPLFLLWIYYTAYVFLLGGEVAETYDLMRMRRLQRVQLG